MSFWRHSASLPSFISSGDFAASLTAHSSTAASNSVGRHDLVDDPDALGLVRVDALAEQQQLGRLLARDVAVDERHDHEREDADVDLGRPEGRLVRRDDQVARQRDAERARQAVPVGRADDRLAELADEREQPREALDADVLVGERDVGREAAEVAAGGEGRLVRRGEHDAADRVVVARRLEGREQVVEQRVGQRVAACPAGRARSWRRRSRRPRSALSRSSRVGRYRRTSATRPVTTRAAREVGSATVYFCGTAPIASAP